jgi:tetratricopeptide (TPR) repeat protein
MVIDGSIQKRSLCVLLAAALAAAELILGVADAGASDRKSRREAARLHQRAAKAAVSGDYVGASRLWRKAYELTKAPKYLYNLARIADETDRPSKALRLYKKFLRVTIEKARKYRQLRSRSETHIRALEKRVATLVLDVPQKGASVFLDQRSLGMGPLRHRAWLDPGQHVVTVKMVGHHGETRQFSVAAGDEKELTVTLRKIKPKVVTKVRMKYPFKRWISWVVLGAGAALAIAGIGPLAYGAKQLDKFDEYVKDQPPGSATDASLKRSGERYRDAGIALLVIGGVTALGGVLMAVFNRPRQVPVTTNEGEPVRPSSGVSVAPRFGRGEWGLTVEWQF